MACAWLACLTVITATAGLADGGRKALVIGIDAYQNVVPLERAVNDARSVATALGEIGFVVTVLVDTDRRALLGGISAFAATLGEGDETVVFYAGHGVALGGRNFLLAADVPALTQGSETFLEGEGIAVDMILATIKDRNVRVATYFLDACRNNPFAAKGTRGIGDQRGLVRPPQVQGTYIIYSAGEGQAALDRLPGADTDANSVFTRVLLPLLAVPNLDIDAMADRIRDEVFRISDQTQWISKYDELIGDYVLNPVGTPAPEPVTPAPAAVTTAEPSPPELPPEPRPLTREDIIRATQVELGRIGCNAGMPDGVAGQRTRTALRFYAMLKGWGDSLPGEIGSDTLLAALEVEPDRICASQWIAARMPMALSGDWAFSMQCPDNLGAKGTAILVVDGNGVVRGAVTNQSGQTLRLSGMITPDRFSGEIDGNGDPPLAFDLSLSAYETKIEGIDAFGCHQSYTR